MAGLLDSVRAGCAAVAARARYVHLQRDRLPAYARELPLAEITAATIDPEHHYLGEPEATVAFFVTLDSINFGSGYFPHLQKRAGLSGYFTVATALAERFARAGPFSAPELGAITAADCAVLFGQEPDGGPRSELMALFANALRDIGAYLQAQHGGAFTALVAAAGGSAERLAELVAAMPYFRDVAAYDDLTVPLYKRAQLLAADLALAFGGEGYGAFRDLDRLTIFADNLVPHVLRLDGLLTYEPALLARIDAAQLIPAGSPEEVEIRAVAVHAVELLAAELREQGAPIYAHQLDYFLWNRGQQPRYKAVPRHRTRTVYY